MGTIDTIYMVYICMGDIKCMYIYYVKMSDSLHSLFFIDSLYIILDTEY